MKRLLRSWLWRVPVDQEVDEEIAFHLEMRTRELVERGMDARTARDTAATVGREKAIDGLKLAGAELERLGRLDLVAA